MVEAVKVLPEEVQQLMDVHIWNVKELQGIMRKKEMGAKVVPTIAINGKVVFQSGIPQHEELVLAIREPRSE